MATAVQRPIGLERDDHVYVRHPERGPIAVRVVGLGRDGLTGICDRGEKHGLPYDAILGHKERVGTAYRVVDAGADGAIVQDQKGRRRYIEHGASPATGPGGSGGPVEPDAPDAPAATEPSKTVKAGKDDPLLDGMERLSKAVINMTDFPSTARVVFLTASPEMMLKAGEIANRPGLTLKESTDRSGRHAKHWVRTAKDMPGPRTGKQEDQPTSGAPMKHGDVVAFRHGDVEGKGRIMGSGADGVTVHDGEREHQVRHDAIVGRAPDEEQMTVTPPSQTHQPSGAGSAPPRAPGPAGSGPPGAPGPAGSGHAASPGGTLFSAEEMAHLPSKAKQPFTDETELYAKSTEALSELKGWLDQGNGICSQLGYQTMGKGMDGVDWQKPGGMLFIAPLKGKARAAEKVKADYGGDWSQLKDVVRCSIAVDTMGDIKDVVDALKAGGMQLAQQPKDRFAKPLPEGYRDLMLSVKFANGTIGEVQVHLKAMLEAKEAGHKPYETMRSIDAKPREQWTDQDRTNWQAAFDQSSKIYGDAWTRASASAPAAADEEKPGEALKKAMGMAGEWEFRDREGAIFRRPKGQPGGVTDVLHQGKWKPYTGDRTAAYLESDPTHDPLGGEPGMMRKAILFLKAAAAPAPVKRSLYVHRKVTNGEEIAKHYRDQGCSPVVDPSDMHATVLYSKTPVDWDSMGSGADALHVPASDERRTAPLGDKGAQVLHFDSPDLEQRHGDMVRAGASHDFPSYKPHVTVSYDGKGFDQAKPWTGPIHFGPEHFGEVKEGWRPMQKAMVVLKALIHGPGQGSLFGVPTPVKAYTTKDGTHVPAHVAIRHKAAPQPISHEAAAGIATAAQAWHADRSKGMRNPPSVSPAAVLGGYVNAHGMTIHDDHEGLILDKMKENTDRAVATMKPLPAPRVVVRRDAILTPAARPLVADEPVMMTIPGDAPVPDHPIPQPPADLHGPSPDAKHFYVSAVDGGRKHLVAGPCGSHAEALEAKPHVQAHAEKHDPTRSHFMAWGTAGSATPLKTPLGENWKSPDKSLAQPDKHRQFDDAGASRSIRGGEGKMEEFVPVPALMRDRDGYTVHERGGGSITVNGSLGHFFPAGDLVKPNHFLHSLVKPHLAKLQSGEMAGLAQTQVNGKSVYVSVTGSEYNQGAEARDRYTAWHSGVVAERAEKQARERQYDLVHNEGAEGFNPHRTGDVPTYWKRDR